MNFEQEQKLTTETKEIVSTPLSRWKKIIALTKDPDTKELAGASFRTIVNAAITAGDIPALHFLGVGELSSWLADGLKVTRIWIAKTGIIDPRILDLTPDRNWKEAIYSEGTELLTCFHTPTHGFESGMQFWFHDRHRIKKGTQELKRIWQLTTEQELLTLQAEKQPKPISSPKIEIPLSDLSPQEILRYVPKPLL